MMRTGYLFLECLQYPSAVHSSALAHLLVSPHAHMCACVMLLCIQVCVCLHALFVSVSVHLYVVGLKQRKPGLVYTHTQWDW